MGPNIAMGEVALLAVAGGDIGARAEPDIVADTGAGAEPVAVVELRVGAVAGVGAEPDVLADAGTRAGCHC